MELTTETFFYLYWVVTFPLMISILLTFNKVPFNKYIENNNVKWYMKLIIYPIRLSYYIMGIFGGVLFTNMAIAFLIYIFSLIFGFEMEWK